MSHQPTVLKFGGTSVADARAFGRVVRIVAARSGESPVVAVVSAMSGITDALLACAAAAEGGEVAEAARLLDRQVERHRAVADALLAGERAGFLRLLDGARGELSGLFESAARRDRPRAAARDAIAAYGELLAAALLASTLREAGLPARCADARRCVVTDGEHGNAKPVAGPCGRRIRAELGALLAASAVPVVGGFVGATARGETTTLGRNGSDYTAALVGAALAAKEIQIWTDVAGVLTTDPRVVSHARTVARLSYREAVMLACFGAKVIYPQAVRPAAERGIPIRILNSRAPEAGGTLVSADADRASGGVKAIAHKGGVSVLRVAGGGNGFRGDLRRALRQQRIAADALKTSESGASLIVSDARSLTRAADELSRFGAVRVEGGCAVVCLVGEGMSSDGAVASRALGALGRIGIESVWHRAARGNVLVAVPEDEARRAVAGLHDLFF